MAAVKGAYEHLVKLLQMTGAGADRYTVSFVVGQQHTDHTGAVGRGDVRLSIMSYGSALKRSMEITSEATYILLDEIHCRSDPTVVSGDLQFTVNNARYKCVHLTATVLTR